MSHKHINISTLQLDLESEFIAKLKILTTYFESRMNGAIAHQMQQSSVDGRRYKLNYGVSLVDMRALAKEIAAEDKIALSCMDYDNLWNTDIREAMLLALLLIPEEYVTVERLEKWVKSIHTNEMADMLPFLAGWKVSDSIAMVEKAAALYDGAGVLQRVAYTNIVGRLVGRGRVDPKGSAVQGYVKNLTKDSIEEAGSVAFLRNMIDRE
ncbi:MAG: DNA alkylation repair protein [Bacteroidales bacterium]|nr:DNA alkylation repair protein [Bacteroidales bacterium]